MENVNCKDCKFAVKSIDAIYCHKISDRVAAVHPDTGDSIMYIVKSDDIAVLKVSPNFGCKYFKKH